MSNEQKYLVLGDTVGGDEPIEMMPCKVCKSLPYEQCRGELKDCPRKFKIMGER
jgi:hypothetical protein